jgi:TetR/AcrR family transcriptional repressor of nem operon
MGNVGRPKTFNNIDALIKAKDLFWSQGYESTSLNELIDAMGISRQSMYNTFGNKHALFLQCLEFYIQESYNNLKETFESDKPAKEKLDLFLSNMEPMFECENSKGCFVSATIQEMATKDEKVKKILETKYIRNYNIFLNFFTDAIEKEEIQSSLTAEELTNLFDSILMSISSLCKLPNKTSQIKSIISTFRKQIS